MRRYVASQNDFPVDEFYAAYGKQIGNRNDDVGGIRHDVPEPHDVAGVADEVGAF